MLNSDRWFCGLMGNGRQCRAIQDGTLVDWDGDCGFLFGHGTEIHTERKSGEMPTEYGRVIRGGRDNNPA